MFDILLSSSGDVGAMEAFFDTALEAEGGKIAATQKFKNALSWIARKVGDLWKTITGFVSGVWQNIRKKFGKVKVTKTKKEEYMSLKEKCMKKIKALPGLLAKIKTAIRSGKEMELGSEDQAAVAGESYVAMEGTDIDGGLTYESDDDYEGAFVYSFELAPEESFLDKMKDSLKAITSFLSSAGNAIATSPVSPIHWLIKAAKAICSVISAAFSKLTSIIRTGVSKVKDKFGSKA